MFLLLTGIRNSNPGLLLFVAIVSTALMASIGAQSAYVLSCFLLLFLPILITDFSNRDTRKGQNLMLTLGSLPIPRSAIIKSRYLAAFLCQFCILFIFATIVMVSPQKVVLNTGNFISLANCALLGLGIMAAAWVWIDIFPKSKPFFASTLSTALILLINFGPKKDFTELSSLDNLSVIAVLAITVIVVEMGVYFRFSSLA